MTSGITTDSDGWITATYNNSSGSSTVFLNYFTNNLALSYNTDYGVFAEIKSVSGSGSLQMVSTSSTYGQFAYSKSYAFSTQVNLFPSSVNVNNNSTYL